MYDSITISFRLLGEKNVSKEVSILFLFYVSIYMQVRVDKD